MVIAAVLGSAALHAVWNAVLKRSADTHAATLLMVVGAGLISGVLALTLGPATVPWAAMPWIACVAASEGLYFYFLARALRALPLHCAYGISRGSGLLVTWPISIAWLKEPPDGRAMVGAAILSAGLVASATHAQPRRALVWVMLCGVTVGLYPLFYKHSLALGTAPFSLFCLSLLGSVPIQFALLEQDRWMRLARECKRSPLTLAAVCLVCAASFLLLLFALQWDGAGRITSLRNTSIIFAAALGALSGETISRRTSMAIVAITAGAILLSW